MDESCPVVENPLFQRDIELPVRIKKNSIDFYLENEEEDSDDDIGTQNLAAIELNKQVSLMTGDNKMDDWLIDTTTISRQFLPPSRKGNE
jgi:hypothetical protein